MPVMSLAHIYSCFKFEIASSIDASAPADTPYQSPGKVLFPAEHANC